MQTQSFHWFLKESWIGKEGGKLKEDYHYKHHQTKAVRIKLNEWIKRFDQAWYD